jgi:hypothetical protein
MVVVLAMVVITARRAIVVLVINSLRARGCCRET